MQSEVGTTGKFSLNAGCRGVAVAVEESRYRESGLSIFVLDVMEEGDRNLALTNLSPQTVLNVMDDVVDSVSLSVHRAVQKPSEKTRRVSAAVRHRNLLSLLGVKCK